MKHILFGLALLPLTACAGAMYQQAQYIPPTATEVQGRCFAKYKKFLDQTTCIEDSFAAYGINTNAFAQEYLAYIGTLREKVKRKSLLESDARTKLTSKHNQLRTLQQNEVASQEQIANQQNVQLIQLRQLQLQRDAEHNEFITKTLFPPRPSIISSPTYTNCQAYGNQINCTSR